VLKGHIYRLCNADPYKGILQIKVTGEASLVVPLEYPNHRLTTDGTYLYYQGEKDIMRWSPETNQRTRFAHVTRGEGVVFHRKEAFVGTYEGLWQIKAGRKKPRLLLKGDYSYFTRLQAHGDFLYLWNFPDQNSLSRVQIRTKRVKRILTEAQYDAFAVADEGLYVLRLKHGAESTLVLYPLDGRASPKLLGSDVGSYESYADRDVIVVDDAVYWHDGSSVWFVKRSSAPKPSDGPR